MSSYKQRTIDFLEIEWATYIERFNRWTAEEGLKRVNVQGYERFRDMLAHVLTWWEEGERIISGILQDPNFKWQDRDTDAFNAELIVKYKKLSDAEVQKQFENKRQDMIRLVKDLPEEVFTNKDIEGWLAADVVEHFDEHAAHA